MKTWNINEDEVVHELDDLYYYTDEVIKVPPEEPSVLVFEYQGFRSFVAASPKAQYLIIYVPISNMWYQNSTEVPDLTEFTEEELFQFSTLNTLDIERVMKGQTAIKTFMEK